MQTVKRLVVLGICSLFLTVPVCIPQEKVDLDVISRIRYEGFRNSRVMETASGLMDQIGARLTGSPNMKRANDWTLAKLKEFGLVNAHLEEWSPFGRGWSNEYVNVRMVSPDTAPLIAYAKAWTPGTDGPVRGQVVRVNIRTPEEIAKYRGKLSGKIVLFGEDPEVKLQSSRFPSATTSNRCTTLSSMKSPAKEAKPACASFGSGAACSVNSTNFGTRKK
jgi:hypothetical protein